MRFANLLDRLPPRPRAVADLAVSTVRDASQDRIHGLAAEMAFWILLSLPPVLLSAASVAGFVGQRIGENVRGQLVERMEELALQVFSPATVDDAITPLLDALLRNGSTSVLSLSFLLTIYSASRVLRVVVLAVTIAYDVEEDQPTWLARILGLGLTLVGLVLGAVLIPLLIAGPDAGRLLEARIGMEVGLATIWRIAYWPVSLVLVTLLIAGLFHYATPLRTPFRRELPGAILSTVLGLLAAVGLRTYADIAIGAQAIYAPLAAPLALLLFLWLEGLALLVGAELNAEIEKAYPTGGPLRETPSLADLGRRAVEGVKEVTGTGR